MAEGLRQTETLGGRTLQGLRSSRASPYNRPLFRIHSLSYRGLVNELFLAPILSYLLYNVINTASQMYISNWVKSSTPVRLLDTINEAEKTSHVPSDSVIVVKSVPCFHLVRR